MIGSAYQPGKFPLRCVAVAYSNILRVGPICRHDRIRTVATPSRADLILRPHRAFMRAAGCGARGTMMANDDLRRRRRSRISAPLVGLLAAFAPVGVCPVQAQAVDELPAPDAGLAPS